MESALKLALSERSYKDGCPYLNYQKPETLLAQLNYLTDRVNELEKACNLAAQVIKQKDTQIAQFQEEIGELKAEDCLEREERYKTERREKSGGKPGAPVGHRGVTRTKSTQIDNRVRVRVKRCPHCGGRVKKCKGKHSFTDHIQEDIEIRKVVTSFRHDKYYCKNCKKPVTGIGEGEIPKSYLGPTAVSSSHILHYQIGLPYNKISEIYQHLFGCKVTTGGFIDMDKRVAQNGQILYNQLEERIRNSSESYTDETGWRKNGENWWLWHSGNKKDGSLYKVDESRGHQVAEEILGKDYQGTLVSDCFSAYNLINASAKQKYLAHLFRDIEKITKIYPNDPETIAFSVNLENILKEGLDLKKGCQEGKYTLAYLQESKERLQNQLAAITNQKLFKKKSEALRKRLVSHKDEIFTFLSRPEVEPTNNFAERQLRPLVVMRKLTGGSRSAKGTKRLAVMMSLIQTAKLQGKDPKDLLLSLILNSPEIRAPTCQ